MNKLREIRKGQKLTMKQLGQIVGVSESTISLYETGKHDPDMVTLNRIADALNVTVDAILGRDEEPDDAFAIRERLRRDPAYRLLFDAADNASPEHLRAAAAMLKALEGGHE